MTTKFTKNNLLEVLKGESVGLSGVESQNLLKEFFKTLEIEVQNGKEIKLHKFGTFKARESAPRKARNFETGEVIEIPAISKLSFLPSKKYSKKSKKKLEN